MAIQIREQIAGCKQHIQLDEVTGVVLKVLDKGRVGIGTDYSITGPAANS